MSKLNKENAKKDYSQLWSKMRKISKTIRLKKVGENAFECLTMSVTHYKGTYELSFFISKETDYFKDGIKTGIVQERVYSIFQNNGTSIEKEIKGRFSVKKIESYFENITEELEKMEILSFLISNGITSEMIDEELKNAL